MLVPRIQLTMGRGGSRGGGPGGQNPRLLGDPQTSQRGKKTLRTCARKRYVVVLKLPGSPPFRKPVSAPDGIRTKENDWV